MARIGLLGGTFNPPHIGHLVCADQAIAQLELDRVLLVPVHEPPHKGVEADPGVEHRVELCVRAAAATSGSRSRAWTPTCQAHPSRSIP